MGLGECSPLRSRPRILRFCLLSPALPQHRCDQGVQRWNVKVWRPMHSPKNLRWNLISFDLVKILRLTSSAPFSHFKSENQHFCSPHFWNETLGAAISHLEIWCPKMSTGGPSWPSQRWFTFNSWIHLQQLDGLFLSFDLVVFKDLFIFNPLIWGDNPIWLYNFSSGLNQLMLNWPKLVVWVPVVWYSNQGTPFHKKDPFHQEIPNLPNHQNLQVNINVEYSKWHHALIPNEPTMPHNPWVDWCLETTSPRGLAHPRPSELRHLRDMNGISNKLTSGGAVEKAKVLKRLWVIVRSDVFWMMVFCLRRHVDLRYVDGSRGRWY